MWTRGGLEPRSCSRRARDAAPTIAPTIFCSDRLAADAGPSRRSHRPVMIESWSTISPDCCDLTGLSLALVDELAGAIS